MVGYIRGLSYPDAKKAIFFITSFAQGKVDDSDLSFDERLSWKNNVFAHLSVQAVTVHADNQLQIHLINVVLADEDCGFIDYEKPFLLKSSEEKAEIIHNATAHYLAEGTSVN